MSAVPPPPGSAVPPPSPADPRRAGHGEVHWKQVLAGFGIALLASQVGAVTASVPMYALALLGEGGSATPAFVPVAVLGLGSGPAATVFAIWWFARHDRKGWAIGAAIYAALWVLLIAACFGVVLLVGL